MLKVYSLTFLKKHRTAKDIILYSTESGNLLNTNQTNHLIILIRAEHEYIDFYLYVLTRFVPTKNIYNGQKEA